MVVFSAVMGYLFGATDVQWLPLTILSFGGYLVTASANVFNQLIEKNLDLLMKRTQNRPLPSERITMYEGFLVALITGSIGLLCLFYFLNPLSGWLGALSLAMYVLLYTPMKRISPLGVFIGAFPGAFPPMLGWVAATGEFGLVPGLLFVVQFMWQFPHFWAIAWKGHDDYERAGFKMLPLTEGKTQRNAFIILLYTVFTIPACWLLYYFNLCGNIYLLVSTLASVYFTYVAYQFYKDSTDKNALKLMFASFIYLPVVQIIMVLDKI